MQLHIRHETIYRYDHPVKYSVQSLHLTPRHDSSQRAMTWSISAPGRRLEQIDAHGNVAHLLTIDEPHREIRILVSGVVETIDVDVRQDDGPLSHLAYLAPTPLTEASERLREFAISGHGAGDDSRTHAMAIAAAVHRSIRYTPGTSEVHDSAARVFESGVGVCQDHSHVFIAACRCIGIPARYVSGYLYTGDLSDIASHAWVDVWLGPEEGWRSIDVTHQRPAIGSYCRLAIGRDYLDAAPVRGVRHGGGAESMQATVLVSQSAQQ